MKSEKEKTPFMLRWWVIAIAVLFAWPLAVAMIITKLIGIVREQRQGKQPMPAERKRQIRKVTTYVILTFLFLALGCIGLTRDYLELFFGAGFSMDLFTDIVPHAALALLGILIASRWQSVFSEESDN